MTRAARHRWRLFAVGFALVGVLFHATVLHWHAAYRFAAAVSEAQLVADLGTICHSNGTVTADADQSQAPAPGDPRTECPICKGLSAFNVAILTATLLGLLEPEPQRIAGITSDYPFAGNTPIAPRSRGPPLSV